MRRVFAVYEILGPALLTPLAIWAWRRHEGDAALTAFAVAIPIAHAYIVPAIGTNVLRMWAFTSRLRIGRFRPQHGFLFGSATALVALPLAGAPGDGDVVGAALRMGAALLAINWVYDALALRHGVLEVYNQPWADKAGPWAIAADYAPWFFGLFGVLYGAGLKLAETSAAPLTIGAATLAATLTLPALCYVAASYARHGHSGCRPAVPRAGSDHEAARS